MAAERGDVIREEEAAEWQGLCPRLAFVRVPDAGHMIPWDNLDGFLAAVRPFLAA